MKNTIVTKEEQQKIFLEILDEVDSFCKKNGLRYFISYGTLLGAVRHGGFIPWDDDVDISMPYPDMIRFKELFHSDKFKYCDVDTEDYYEYPFSRICYLPTYKKDGLIGKTYGVNIDLYPVVGCPEKDEDVELFFSQGRKLLDQRKKIIKLRKHIIQKIPVRSIPGYNKIIRKYRDHILQYPFENAKRYFHVGGPLKWYEVFDYDVFNELIEIGFEGKKYMAPAKYDEYLKQCYGDYMTPPPIEKRKPYHGGTYYWRDK